MASSLCRCQTPLKIISLNFNYNCGAYFTHMAGLAAYSLWNKVSCSYLFGTLYCPVIGFSGYF